MLSPLDVLTDFTPHSSKRCDSQAKVIVQRVTVSQVAIDGQIIGAIARGLNLLAGIAERDTEAELDWMTQKYLEVRLFPDENGRFDRSLMGVQGEGTRGRHLQ